MGQLANEVRSALEAAIEAAAGKLEAQALEQRLKDEALDVTIPGCEVKLGHKHPMYLALDELKAVSYTHLPRTGSCTPPARRCFFRWPG